MKAQGTLTCPQCGKETAWPNRCMDHLTTPSPDGHAAGPASPANHPCLYPSQCTKPKCDCAASPANLHQWVPPTGPVKWEHCSVCGIIKNKTNSGNQCKGRAEIVMRTSTSPANLEPDAQVVERQDAIPFYKVAWLCKDIPIGTSLYAIPPGWTLVPLEPNERILGDMSRAYEQHLDRLRFPHGHMHYDAMQIAYRAMLNVVRKE